MTKYLSTGDAGRWLGISQPSIRRLVRNGELRIAATTEGGIHLFLPADVYALAQRRAQNVGVRYPAILREQREGAQHDRQ